MTSRILNSQPGGRKAECQENKPAISEMDGQAEKNKEERHKEENDFREKRFFPISEFDWTAEPASSQPIQTDAIGIADGAGRSDEDTERGW